MDIKPYHIEEFIHELKTTKSQRTGKPLSAKTIKHYRDLLRVIFNKARKMKIIHEVSTQDIEIPSIKRNIDGHFYESDEIQPIIQALKEKGDFRYYVFYLLQIHTGCRPSEMYGLKWNKLDLVKGIITIDEALVKTSKGYIQKTTKEEDTRVQTLSDYLIEILKELKEEEKDNNSEYVFTNSNGEHMRSGAFREYFRRFCEKNNLRYVYPYGLRHTTGTLLAAKKIPMADIAKKLGHSDPSTTTIYVHPTQLISNEIQDILAKTTTPITEK